MLHKLHFVYAASKLRCTRHLEAKKVCFKLTCENEYWPKQKDKREVMKMDSIQSGKLWGFHVKLSM